MARTIEARAVISATDKASPVFAKVARNSRMLEHAGRTGAVVDRATRSALAFGGAMLGAGIGAAAVGAAVIGGIKDYAALERTMTRVGLAAGATDAETKTATARLSQMAQDIALPFDEAVAGLDALVATGKSLPEAMAFLPAVLRTAQATGAATQDMAASAAALATSLKLPADQMQAAFDALVVGGQLGQFELKDMAQYLPSLAASAAKLGYEGLEGTKKIVAMLQVVRQVSGTSGEAATAVGDAFEKLLSPTVANAFKKRGVDIGKVLSKAARDGKDQFEAVLDVLARMTRGMDETQRNMLLGSIFTDKEARRAISAMITLRDEYEKYLASINASPGATQENLNRVLADQQAAIDRLTNAWSNLWKAVGAGADAAGASSVMEGATEVITDAVRLATDPDYRQKRASDIQFGNDTNALKVTDRDIARAERLFNEAGEARDSRLFPYVPGEAERGQAKAQADYQRLLAERSQAEARAYWNAVDRGYPQAPPAWLQDASTPQDIGSVPSPPRDPRRGAAPDIRALLGDLTATVEGPVTAELKGSADVTVNVRVDASPDLISRVQSASARTSGPLKASTGVSMPETWMTPAQQP